MPPAQPQLRPHQPPTPPSPLSRAGSFDVELSVEGSVLLIRQRDQPGIVGHIGTLLAKENVNISFMTVRQTNRGVGVSEGGGVGGAARPLSLLACAGLIKNIVLTPALGSTTQPPTPHFTPHLPTHTHTHSPQPSSPQTPNTPPPQVCRTGRNEEAVMAVGVDSEPPESILKEIRGVKGVLETTVFKEMALV